MTTIRVRVPASSANLGPGFDSLALALALYNTVEVTALPGAGEPAVRVEVTGEGADELPTGETNVVVQALRAAFAHAGQDAPRMHVRLANNIPLQSGLGSSASACVAGVAAARALLGAELDRNDVFRLAAELEGHPDNASGAVFGGLVASSRGVSGFVARRLPVAPGLHVAVALPAVRVSTPQQRAALPRQVPLADAAENIGRALLVAEALARADYDLLAEVMCDRLHEPYRTPHIAGAEAAIAAGREAGAAAVALSGSGPALIAFAPSGHAAIADAMRRAFEREGIEARVWTLPVDQEGVTITAR